MTVYVDDMKAEFLPPHRKGARYVMSHMIADTEAELHTMAARIGVARKWYQGDHYDIAQSKRTLAISHGAVLITWRELGRKTLAARRARAGAAPGSCTGRLI